MTELIKTRQGRTNYDPSIAFTILAERPELWDVPGIYCLLSEDNGRAYIGSAGVTIAQRVETHFKNLKRDKHINTGMQFDWNAGRRFKVGILTQFHPEGMRWLMHAEQHWIEKLRWEYRLYNRAPACNCKNCRQFGDMQWIRRISEYYGLPPL